MSYQRVSRSTLLRGFGAAAVLAGAGLAASRVASAAKPDTFEVHFTSDQWRARLGPQRYNILREAGTEPAGSSPLDQEHRHGTFACAGCDLPLYSSSTKFNSGTGWPSFYRPLPNAVRERSDYSLIEKRIEVLCRRCGGHLGHVFNDGPPPTGLRYCMNGLALQFHPGKA
ncbi:MAG: peptide-methionine (R)-S-oxide reductase MsrB [Candidatus Eremiobacteraeota bacterium]|nr:peptide-methionine (R)-S-oxide reductase MsrB [Candidatus Eremiobacteraeota bacterium]